jgi:AcrR family transcriptional regulator
MPYPAQMDANRIVYYAREVIEAEGVDNLSLNKLATLLGVKAPSLYRHFASKNDLLRAVNLHTGGQLVEAILAAVETAADDPQARVRAMAHAYRAFVHAHPQTYSLMFGSLAPELRPDAALLEGLAIPLQKLMAAISGEADSLAALRGMMALVHGFAILELNGQFQRGGDLGEAFSRVVDAYIAGWA